MNPDQTEAIMIGTNVRQQAESSTSTLDLQTISVKPTTSIKSLRVSIDSTLSVDVYVDSVCKSSYFHLRALHHIRNHISEDTTKAIACSVIHEQLDYCSSVLYSMLAANLIKLQRVQNKDQTL